MFDVRVVNKHKETTPRAVSVNIMRPGIWGNPYKMESKFARDEVLRDYQVYIETRFQYDGDFAHQMKILWRKMIAGEVKYLVCCCKPRPCHGDILLDFITEKWGRHLVSG